MKTQLNPKITAIAVALAMGVAGFSTLSIAKPEDLNQSPLVSDFKALDVDNDGTLTKSEASKDKMFNKSNFDAADTDHDGTLTQTEFADYKSMAQSKETGRIVDDSVITAKVKADILKDEGFKGLQISVKTHKGIVQLSGFVDNKTQITRAEEIAKATEGVKSVKNSLLVKS